MIPLLLNLALAADPPTPPTGNPAPEAEPPPLVKAPQLLEFVQAPYPPDAQAEGVQGKVLLAIEIDETGAVTKVDVLRPLDSRLDAAAVEAAKGFAFAPAEDATGPVPVIIEFEYGFVLEVAPPATPETPTAPQELPINLEGVVLEMGTRRPLADIPLRLEPSGMETTTDATGHYAFRGVPVGELTIKGSYPGFQPMEEKLSIAADQVTEAKLWIRNYAYGDAGIVGIYDKEKVEVTQRTISMAEVRRIPGTFGDPIRVIQSLPGAARSPFGTGLLIIRGSNPEDTGVYVDGIRIPNIYHLGGFESVFNPDLVSTVDYLPGGFGVQYGRTMGGTVDVTTKAEFPDQPHISWGSNILNSGALFTAALGKDHQHGFGVAARRSYIDLILPAFTKDTGFVAKPKWYDYQVKYQYQGERNYHFSVLAFGFQDVLITSTPAGFAQGTDQDTQGDLSTRYATHRIVVNFEAPLSQSLSLRLTPSFGQDYGEFGVGDTFSVSNNQFLIETRAELPWEPSEHFRLVPGVDFIGGWAKFDIQLPFDPSVFGIVDPFAEREPFTLNDTQPGWGPDFYLFAQLRPLKDTDALLIVPGLRLNYVNIVDEVVLKSLDPRLSVRWAMVPDSRIKASVGLYSQPPQPFEIYRPDSEPVDLINEKTFSTTLGFEQDFGQAVSADAEIFYKWMYDLTVTNPDFAGLDSQFFLSQGHGRSYGAEFMLRHNPIGNFFGWASYTLSRSERKDYPDSDWHLFDFDQTHIFSGVAGYKLPLGFEISGKAQYVTGNPTSTYDTGVYDLDLDYYNAFDLSGYNNERLPPYWSLSLRLDKNFIFKTWSLDAYIDVINVLRGVNPEFTVYNYDYTESRYIRGLPTIPGPGFEIKADF